MSVTSDTDPTSSNGSLDETLGDVPDAAEGVVRDHRRSIEAFTKLGWLAKGVVYVLFGITAVAIAQQDSPQGEASPQGALGQVMDATAGRFLLGVLAVGLLLYSLWRLGSVLLVGGHDATAWGDRIGYLFSAVFYVVLGVTAAQSAISGRSSGGSSSVETVSRSLLENGVGRWMLGIGGVVTIAVGGYFVVRKGIMRSFTDDVSGVSEDASANHGLDHAIWIGGVVGWIGRGIATVLVGWFVTRSAVEFDASEARGFDQALRETASSGLGSVLVWIVAVGLVLYGSFCVLTHRRRSLLDTS